MYSTWVKGETSHIKRNTENVESDQGDSNEQDDRKTEKRNGFLISVRRHENDLRQKLRADGVAKGFTTHALLAAGDFGPAKSYIGFTGRASDDTAYAFVVDRRLAGELGVALEALERDGADSDAVLTLVEKYALQKAFYVPTEGTFSTIGPIEGTPAFEFHKEDLHDTGQRFDSGKGDKIFQVKGTNRDQVAHLFGLLTAFHKENGDGTGGEFNTERGSGAKVGKKGGGKFNAEVLTAPTAAQSAKATANPPENIKRNAEI